jgi:AraC-like DNA-binding protein
MHQIPVRHLQNPEFSGGFSIRDIGQLLNGKDMVQKLHRHDFFLVIVLQRGRGKHDIDFISHTVKDNAVFFLRPGQVHELELKAGCAGYIMQFKAEFYPASSELLRQVGQQNHYHLDDIKFNKLVLALTTIFQEQTEKKARYGEVILANMGIFFVELLRQQQNSVASPEGRYKQERLEKFMSLLEQHILNKKQVGEYAGMLNLSVYQLNAITKEVVGKTTSALINEQITLEAKRCLLATSYQVNQVAYHMGYEDPSYFIRFFKKQTGHSPEAFRHNYR